MLAAAAAAGALLLAPASSHADTCKGAAEPIRSASIPAAERSLLCLVNVHRAANGLGALTHDPSLRAAARAHSEDMIARRFFDHTNPDGQNPSDRAAAAGYPHGAGENIAFSSFPDFSARDMFEGWLNSPGHNANMLNPPYVTAGMGFALAPLHGTQKFGMADAGATDTALDLLVPAACRSDRAMAKRLARRVARWRKRLRKAKRRGDRPAIRKARRQLRRSRSELKRVRLAAASSCNPTSF